MIQNILEKRELIFFLFCETFDNLLNLARNRCQPLGSHQRFHTDSSSRPLVKQLLRDSAVVHSVLPILGNLVQYATHDVYQYLSMT